MAERELELRLRAVARELDARGAGIRRRPPPIRAVAGGFEEGSSRSCASSPWPAPPRRRPRSRRYSICSTSTKCPSSAGLAPGVAPPFAGRSVPVDAVQASVPFRVRMISSLGAPDDARVRDDITGGMVTIAYGGGRILLTQWRTTDVQRPHRARPRQRRRGGRHGRRPAGPLDRGRRARDVHAHRRRRSSPPRELRGRHRRAAVERRCDDVPPPGRGLQGRGDAACRRGRPLAAKRHPARNWPTSRATMSGSSNQGM